MTELSASAGSEGYAACDDDGGVFAFAAGGTSAIVRIAPVCYNGSDRFRGLPRADRFGRDRRP